MVRRTAYILYFITIASLGSCWGLYSREANNNKTYLGLWKIPSENEETDEAGIIVTGNPVNNTRSSHSNNSEDNKTNNAYLGIYICTGVIGALVLGLVLSVIVFRRLGYRCKKESTPTSMPLENQPQATSSPSPNINTPDVRRNERDYVREAGTTDGNLTAAYIKTVNRHSVHDYQEMTNLDLLRQENQSQRPSSSSPDEYSDINPPDVSINEYDYAEEKQTSGGNSLAVKAVKRHWSRDHPGYICSIWPS